MLTRGTSDQKFEQIDEYLSLFEKTKYFDEQLIVIFVLIDFHDFDRNNQGF